MPELNNHILVACCGIAVFSVVRVWSHSTTQPITPVLIGCYVLLLLLSILDLFGGVMSQLASAFAMLALVTAILTAFPWAELALVLQYNKNKTA